MALIPPKLVRSNAVHFDDFSTFQALHILEQNLQAESLTIIELRQALGISRKDAAMFFQHFQNQKTIISSLFYFFDSNQIRDVLTNICRFYIQ